MAANTLIAPKTATVALPIRLRSTIGGFTVPAIVTIAATMTCLSTALTHTIPQAATRAIQIAPTHIISATAVSAKGTIPLPCGGLP